MVFNSTNSYIKTVGKYSNHQLFMESAHGAINETERKLASIDSSYLIIDLDP